MISRIEEIREAALAEIDGCTTSDELEQARIHWLGRKAELPNMLRGIRELPEDERGPAGQAANVARTAIEELIEGRLVALKAAERGVALARGGVDVTLPGAPEEEPGRLHLLTVTLREVEDVFLGLGYSIAEGPEIELVEYNFDALNHEATHPARSHTDTFYVDGNRLLRTHTSPVQIRAMLAQAPPIRVIAPGRVYRRDDDATHTPQFHQVEGLAVDEGITLADLKGTLLEFSRAMFGGDRDIRLRPHFFPFTEPSVEIDVSCFACDGGTSAAGSRCSLCKGTAWIEILGAGMVDPNVFAYVAGQRPEYDPALVQGFAFGVGIERIAMLKHGVPDLRLLYANDARFLRQFG